MTQWMSGIAHFFMQYGIFGLFILSFVEASFFPVPPYLLSVPMTLAQPRLGFLYALVGTAGSVLGGLFGYMLGYRLGHPLLVKFFKPAVFKKIEAVYRRYGDWATAAGGLTPFPYKIFAISAGVFRSRLATFIPASIFARGIRFFGEALLLILYGRKVLRFVESLFGPANLGGFAILVLAVFLVRRTGWIPEKFRPVLRRLRQKWLARAARIRERFLPAGLFSWRLITGATLTAFGFLLFAKLASELLEREMAHFDGMIGKWVAGFRSGSLTILMQGITNLGSTVWIIGLVTVISVLGLYFRKRLVIIALNVAVLGAMLLSESLKGAFHRIRPEPPWLTQASGFSFPSGHALISMTLYGFLAYLVFRNKKWPRRRFILAGILILLPFLIGISRVYLGVHYPTDVLAGWAVAAGWIGACIGGIELLGSKFTRGY